MNKNGTSRLNDFTYKNIMGRGGRMFRHFIGKIYYWISLQQRNELNWIFHSSDEILGDLDERKFEKDLTKEQVAKIIQYKEDMTNLLEHFGL